MSEQEAIALMLDELDKARAKHPQWPVDVLHAAAILSEESGEVVKASIDMTYAGGSVEDVRKELAQTGAMCLRMLINLDWAETLPEQLTEPRLGPADAFAAIRKGLGGGVELESGDDDKSWPDGSI